MIIRPKTLRESDSSWCVILNLIRGELVKSRVVEKLSQSFSITEEEASQLLESAPVVLLEDLAFDVAQKIKSYFQESGIEMLITNNSLEKRKCFKTFWPEEPRLNFLDSVFLLDGSQGMLGRKEILTSDQAVAHIREEAANHQTAVTAGSEENMNDFQKKYAILSQQYSLLLEEKSIQDQKIEALENESRFLREKDNSTAGHLRAVAQERDNLRQEVEALRTKYELAVKEREAQVAPQVEQASRLEEESRGLRERLEALRKEYEQAQQIWMGKLKAKEDEEQLLKNEMESCKSQLSELARKWEEDERTYRRMLTDETSRLQEKALKDLVLRQQELEREITDKEKLLRGVLAEQERLEKEIVRTR